MEDGLESGLFSIALSDEESGGEGTTAASGQNSTDATTTKADRTAQSEDAFLAVKRDYRPKLDNGEIWKTIALPLGESVPKQAAQEILHAVEELYFFRRYDEAAAFVRKVLEGGGGEGLDTGTKALMKVYEGKCLSKLSKEQKV